MGYRGEPKDMIREFFVLPAEPGSALPLFRRLIEASHARRIEAQTNDVLLTLMLYDFASNITSETVIFNDALTTNLIVPGATFRRVGEADAGRIFEHKVEGVGDWLIEVEASIVATGGIALHYNPPYGDLYMEVAEPSTSTRIRQLPHPGAEASRLRDGPDTRCPLQRRERGVPGDAPEGWSPAMRRILGGTLPGG